MKCAIWGAGQIGVWLHEAIKRKHMRNTWEVICFGDNNAEIIGQFREGLQVLQIEAILDLYERKQIDAIIIATRNVFVDKIVSQLVSVGVSTIYMVQPELYHKKLDELELDRDLIKIDTTKPRLDYVEYHVTDHCNLNCKGCGHFCPIVTERVYGKYDLFEKDIKRLKELFWGICKVRLLGGEPLLNPELYRFIEIVRKVFPDSTISVVTNGLLIPSMPNELFEVMHKNNCIFEVSCYKPTQNLLPHIKMVCAMYDIRCCISEPIKIFGKRRDIHGSEDPLESYRTCATKTCTYLHDGKISACAAPQIMGILNKAFDLHLTPGKKDIINLYEKDLDGYELVNRLRSPLEMCKYCKRTAEVFEWESIGHNYKLEHWTVE